MFINLRTLFAGAFAVVIILLTVLLSYLIGYESSKTAEVSIGRSLAGVAHQLSANLDNFMWARAGEIEALSNMEVFQKPIDKTEATETLNHLKASLPVFTWVGYTDLQGNVLASTDNLLLGQNIKERPIFKKGLNGPYFGDVHDAVLLASLLPNPGGGSLQFVDIGIPVKDKSGRTLGMLGAHLSWEWSKQVEAATLGPFKESMEGVQVMVVGKNQDKVLLGPGGDVGKVMNDPAVHHAQEGGNSWIIEQSDNGKSYLTGYAYGNGYQNYSGLGWSVIVRQPTEIAFASVHRLQQYIALCGLATALLFGIAGWFLAGWIVRPLKRIAESADVLSSGGQAEIPSITHIRDLSNLSHSLRNLIDNLTQAETELGHMSDMARHDVLTGLPNRLALDDYLAHAVTKAKQNRSTLSFLYMDLDGFKKVNDTMGHGAGDKLLQEVAFRLLDSTRDHEMVTRLGGDEFVIILHTSALRPMQEAEAVAKRIIDKINQPYLIDGQIVHVGCSVGAAVWSPESQDTSEILRLADEALYISKRSGKNRITFEKAV
ncbi:Cyclic di-GMP phosphodiesterase Gmr [compost metagenome]